MWSDYLPTKQKAAATFLDNATLAILEYILEEGMEGALAHFKGITEEEIKVFPHVVQALKERGYLTSEKSDLNKN